MRRIVIGLSFTLAAGLASPGMAQTTLVILNPDNGYMDEVEPGVFLTRDPVSGKGPLRGGSVLEFACGTCEAATFDAVPPRQLGGSVRLCGLRPVDIVLMDIQVCMRSTVSGSLYDLDLMTWDSKSFPCRDADGGASCASSGGFASYLRSPFVEAVDPLDLLEVLMQDVAGLDLRQGLEQSLMTKLDGAWKKLSDANPANDVAAVGKLQAFVNQVEAQAGKQIEQNAADALVAEAQAIIAALQGG